MKKVVLTVWEDGLWFASTDEGGDTIAKGDWSRDTRDGKEVVRATAESSRDYDRERQLCIAVCDAVRAMNFGGPRG